MTIGMAEYYYYQHHGPRPSLRLGGAYEADFCLWHNEPREAIITLVLDLISAKWFLPLMDENLTLVSRWLYQNLLLTNSQ